MQVSHDSLLDLTFPNHQINQDGDQAHGDEREGHHQLVRCILKGQILLSAVVEVVGVDVEEEVLNVGVWIVAVNHLTQILQARCHATVWSVIDEETIMLMRGLETAA